MQYPPAVPNGAGSVTTRSSSGPARDGDLRRSPRAQNLLDQRLFLLDQALSLRVSAVGVAPPVKPLPKCVQILTTRMELVVSHRR